MQVPFLKIMVGAKFTRLLYGGGLVSLRLI
jgi:hypothetical protein